MIAQRRQAVLRRARVAEAVASGDLTVAADASDALLDYMEFITRAAVDW
jgi:hypothetical protein